MKFEIVGKNVSITEAMRQKIETPPVPPAS